MSVRTKHAGRPKRSKSPPPAPAVGRSAGILLHVTSLPGPYGIGDFGPAAYAWVDLLARAKQRWWQILPLGPPGAGNSPYQCYSAFAGNPDLVSPDLLVRDGLLRRDDLPPDSFSDDRVDYPRIQRLKRALIDRAWERYKGGAGGKRLYDAVDEFINTQASWLDDFSLFMALKEAKGTADWTWWGDDLAQHKQLAWREALGVLSDAVERQQFAQYLFFRQLNALRKYARERGVRLIGDLPIYVSADSADVWANRHLFQLDKSGRPTAVAGVPPDLFSKTGQRWGNPLYDWRAMRRDGFAWWVERARAALAQVDLTRIDHFRGFEAFWRVPASEPTAQHGKWVKAPGDELFEVLQKRLGSLPFIAEDLGVITPEVEALRDRFNMPGMRVLQFGVAGADPANPHLPHHYVRNCVAYTGTHDNDTTAGWFASLKKAEKKRVARYVPGAEQDPAWALMRAAWASVADYAIAPLQDVLRFGREARMNVPGKATGNWGWRVAPKLLRPDVFDRLGELTETYGRTPLNRPESQ